MVAGREDGDKFLEAQVPTTTPIFIDQNLADDIQGQEVAIQLKNRGYSKIHLASADATLKNVPGFILSVRGKEFPGHSALANA